MQKVTKISKIQNTTTCIIVCYETRKLNLLYIHKIQNGVFRQILMKNGETVELSVRKTPKIRKNLALRNNTY